MVNSPPEAGAGEPAAAWSLTQIAPLAVVFVALYALLAALLAPPGILTPVWLVSSAGLALVLGVLSAIDLKTYRLPDIFTLPLAGAGLLLAAATGGSEHLLWRAVSAASAFAVLAFIALAYERVRGRSGLGLGDAKLFGAAGAWLGAAALPMVLLLATLTALGPALVNALRQGRLDSGSTLAFGPYLALGFWIVWVMTT